MELQERLQKWVKSWSEYQRIATQLYEKGESLHDEMKEFNATPSFVAGAASGDIVSTSEILRVLRKVEGMRAALCKKTEVMLSEPMSSFSRDLIQPTLSMESHVSSLRKKLDRLQKDLRKQKDPYKIAQLEGKVKEMQTKYDVEHFKYVNGLKDIEEKGAFSFHNWLMAYAFANLSFFRQGYQTLESLEADLKQTTKTIDKEEGEQEKISRKSRIATLKQLHLQHTSPESENERQGYLKWNGKPHWFTVLNGILSHYRRATDDVAKGSVDLLLCTVKSDLTKEGVFMVISPEESFELHAANAEECQKWTNVIQNSIAQQLETHKKVQASSKMQSMMKSMGTSTMLHVPPLVQLQLLDEENLFCADCRAKDPDWVAFNLGLLVCHNCSGVHRSLGTHISKIRSLTLDKWEPQLLQVQKFLGNTIGNRLLESDLSETVPRPEPDATREERDAFIAAKYRDKRFVKRDPSENVTKLSERLYECAVSNEASKDIIPQMLELIVRGANINWVNFDENCSTTLHFLAATDNLVGLEFLLQNDAGLNAVDRRGWSPLHYAAHHDNAGCARILINRGAMINLQDQEGKSPLHVATESNSNTTKTLLEDEYTRRGIEF